MFPARYAIGDTEEGTTITIRNSETNEIVFLEYVADLHENPLLPLRGLYLGQQQAIDLSSYVETGKEYHAVLKTENITTIARGDTQIDDVLSIDLTFTIYIDPLQMSPEPAIVETSYVPSTGMFQLHWMAAPDCDYYVLESNSLEDFLPVPKVYSSEEATAILFEQAVTSEAKYFRVISLLK